MELALAELAEAEEINEVPLERRVYKASIQQ
jgi:hypothetical protein